MLISTKDVENLRKYHHARGHANDYDTHNLGFGYIHYSFIRTMQYINILVVGSQRGFVPAICALACKHNRKGLVHFVDAGLCSTKPEDNVKDGEKSWGGLGVWKNAKSSYWEPLGVEDYIKLYVMNTETFARKHKQKFDYIYIDGDHSYEGVKRDYKFFKPMANGHIVFHEVLVEKNTEWGLCGVKKFWDELNVPNKITIPTDCGLGIIQV